MLEKFKQWAEQSGKDINDGSGVFQFHAHELEKFVRLAIADAVAAANVPQPVHGDPRVTDIAKQVERDAAELAASIPAGGYTNTLFRIIDQHRRDAFELGRFQPAQPTAVPENCCQRLMRDGKPYPKSSCYVCGQLSPKWRKCDAALAAAPQPAQPAAVPEGCGNLMPKMATVEMYAALELRKRLL